jgi:hypothetical protein
MRPCGSCGTALENRQTVCPRCGVTQAEGPKATPGPPPERPGRVAQFFNVLRDFSDIAPTGLPDDLFGVIIFVVLYLPFLLLLSSPLVIGGAIGYYIGDAVGALVGVIATAVLFVGVVAWREERYQTPNPQPTPDAAPKKRLHWREQQHDKSNDMV